MDITNNSGLPISINRVYATWVKSSPSQKLSKLLLNGALIWNISDNNPPSDIPAEGNFVNGADLSIPDPLPRNFVVQFQEPLQSGTYQVHVVFDLVSCQVSGSFSVP
jgi:hypothetical protein